MTVHPTSENLRKDCKIFEGSGKVTKKHGFGFRGSFFRVKVAVFNDYIRFYPTVLGLRFMRPSEVKKP